MRIICMFLSAFLIISCGSNSSHAVLEPEPGCTITISAVNISKPEHRVNGLLIIENNAESFVKVSNQELFMYSGNDSVRTHVSLIGTWKIDEGLINVMKGKKITLQVYWPFLPAEPAESLRFRYVKHLER